MMMISIIISKSFYHVVGNGAVASNVTGIIEGADFCHIPIDFD